MLERVLVWASILLSLLVGSLVVYVEIYHDLPVPHHYSVKCFRLNGKLIYEDTSRYVPSSRSGPYVSCVTKGEDKP